MTAYAIPALGIRLTPMRTSELLRFVGTVIETNQERVVIANHNLHSLYLLDRSRTMRQFYERADATIVDGFAILLISRIYGIRLHRDQRITCVDWIRPFFAEASRRGWNVFFLGGRQGVGELALQWMKKDLPGISFAHHQGYFDPDPLSAENLEVLSSIGRAKPDVLLVGMGMPLQEQWILENLNNIQARVIVTVGACFDYMAGVIPSPPRWAGPLGLEWIFRLLAEPRRLAARYLIEPWAVLGMVLRGLCLGRKKYGEKID